jgi:phytanoyl-CoA hydroxylase
MRKSLQKYFFFKFTSISSSQIQNYKDFGYVILPDFVPLYLIHELEIHVSNLIANKDFSEELLTFRTIQQYNAKFLETGRRMHYFLDEYAIDQKKGGLKVPKHLALNKIGHAMHDLDPIFRKFSYRTDYKEILRAIGYKNPLLMQSQYIFKHPKKEGTTRVDPHTDNTYLITSPLSTIGFWIALDHATKENGCLWGVPASHKTKTTLFLKREKDGEGTYYEEKEYPKKNLDINGAIPLEAKKRSLIIFHGDFVHYSHDNYSDESSHAYTMHFVESEGAEWIEDNWLQRPKYFPPSDYYTSD